ncbi:MAG: DUF222 domain-containing protein [Enhygromyxa sp.]
MSELAVLDEPLSPTALESLGDEIATFAARIDVAEHALLTRLRLFDAHEGWGRAGAISCAQWLSWRTGLGPKAAREKVRVARALGGLPRVDALFGRGELSYSKVRAITRVATEQTEQHFIDIAVHATASQIERLARAYRRVHSQQGVAGGTGEPPLDQRRYMRRVETWSGMVRLEIQLPPEEAAIVWSAVSSALEGEPVGDDGASAGALVGALAAVHQEASAEASVGAVAPAEASAPANDQASAEAPAPANSQASAEASAPASDQASAEAPASKNATQAEADPWQPAPTELALRLWGPPPPPQPITTTSPSPSTPPSPPPANDDPTLEERRADAMVDLARAYLKHRPRTLGSPYELVVITSPALLEQVPSQGAGQGAGQLGGFLPDGTPIPLHVARMLASDGGRVDVVMGERGELLDVGRRTRAIPSAISRALWLRDGGCRVPGCERRRHLHAHHIQGWAEGGPTRLSNLVLTCSSHHRMIHEGRLRAEICEEAIVFVDQDGRELATVPPKPSGWELEQLELYLREIDLHLDEYTALGQWDGTQVELGELLDWVLLAEQEQEGSGARAA